MALHATLSSILGSCTPDEAVLLASVGLALIFWELNRPGSILPGASGLLCLLFAVFPLSQQPWEPGAALLLATVALIFFSNLWLQLPFLVLLAATAGLTAGLRFLVAPSPRGGVSWTVALGCGLLLGGLGSTLSRIALRARRAKQVN